MKKTNKFLLAIGAAAAVGLTIYAIRRHRSNKRHHRVAEEGYETAHDVLFPKKNRSSKLRYGPVLPE